MSDAAKGIQTATTADTESGNGRLSSNANRNISRGAVALALRLLYAHIALCAEHHPDIQRRVLYFHERREPDLNW